jgi:pyruvate,water dikinase
MEQALALFDDATRRHAELVGVHSFGFLVGQNHYSTLARLCAELGLPGLELELTGSGEGTVETAIVHDVQRLADGTLTPEAFVGEHGYRGPDEGELSARSWREDPSPVIHLAELYRKHPPQHADTAGRFNAARARLLDAVPSRRRRKVARLIDRVVRYMQLREIGKASFVRSKDVGRAAARRIGELLVADGLLDDADDVFLLTRTELGSPSSYPLRETVALRRRQRAEYEALEIPDHFEGVPTPIEPTTSVDVAQVAEGSVVSGIAASPGTAEGLARVVRDPSELDEFEPGDVLVCELTDPAWAPLMQLAAAVAIDIGGPLSHGAIVARELGIPAVIGTGDGTARIPDGARVRVDGSTGQVVVLEASRAGRLPD